MIAPPRPPAHDELEALIKEARARQLRRRLLGAAGVAIAAALGLSIYALVGGGDVKNIAQPPARGGSATGPLCRASQLSVSAALQGATQSLAGGATITNTARSTCSLPRLHPVVRISLDGKTLRIKQRPFPYRISPGRPVARVLMPHEQAAIFVQWWNWCGKTGAATMTLRFGRGLAVTAPQRLGEPTCIGTEGGPSRLYVSPPFAST
jgi:Protein of unknown function (DUF4232)